MPAATAPCPHCQGLALWLENVSQEAYVDYYRCSKCALVWNVRKEPAGPSPEMTIVQPGMNEEIA
jgi:hypothetical protein